MLFGISTCMKALQFTLLVGLMLLQPFASFGQRYGDEDEADDVAEDADGDGDDDDIPDLEDDEAAVMEQVD